jgi:hypothetical protein
MRPTAQEDQMGVVDRNVSWDALNFLVRQSSVEKTMILMRMQFSELFLVACDPLWNFL